MGGTIRGIGFDSRQRKPSHINRLAELFDSGTGESNLLAGLIRQEDRRTLRGLPGLLRLPVLRHLFGSNDTTVQETDIVMLLTPRIVRTRQLTLDDVRPLHIGTQRNIGVSGPPPLIAPPVVEPTGPDR